MQSFLRPQAGSCWGEGSEYSACYRGPQRKGTHRTGRRGSGGAPWCWGTEPHKGCWAGPRWGQCLPFPWACWGAPEAVERPQQTDPHTRRPASQPFAGASGGHEQARVGHLASEAIRLGSRGGSRNGRSGRKAEGRPEGSETRGTGFQQREGVKTLACGRA